MAVFCNVFLGMQLPLSSYLQVCFSILNDVVMSISIMYEKPESGEPYFRLIYLASPDQRTFQTSCTGNRAMPAPTVSPTGGSSSRSTW